MNRKYVTMMAYSIPIILVGLLLGYHVSPSNAEVPAQNQEVLPPGGMPALQGITYYVATTGDDSKPGTEAQPWRTIQKAADTLVAGDTVYIRAGTYQEQVIPQNSGSAGLYITYAAYPGETVTIDGSSITLPDALVGLFNISGKDYIWVSGLRVINAGPWDNNAGILVDESSYIVLEHNYTYNTVSSGIGVWGGGHVVIDGNRVEHACTDIWQECLTVASTDVFEIKHNEVFDCQEEGIDAKDGASNGKIYRNHVHHVDSTGLYLDAWDKHTHDIDVFQNIVHDIGDNGFALASEAGGLLENIRVYNNIAYHNRWVGFSVTTNGLSGPMNAVAIVNNTAYNNGWTGWGGGILVDNPNVENVVVRNNIASQNLYFQIAVGPGVPLQNLAVDHNLIDGFRETEGEIYGDDYVEGDPLFVNASGADFHLQPSSPAVDQGSAVDAPTHDFDGHPRPQDGDEDGTTAYDIGAYELGSSQIYLPLVLKASPSNPSQMWRSAVGVEASSSAQ